jgi:N-methylhydantoinase B
VISAERPFPMRVWMTYPMTVIDTIFKAMAQAIPESLFRNPALGTRLE